jgi:outer membrane protein TolC
MHRFLRGIAMASALFVSLALVRAGRAVETVTLDQAIARALEIAPTVANATANSDLNRARIDEARAPLYPTIAGAGDYTQSPGYDEVITNRGQTLAEATLDYAAFDGGRRRDQVRAARYAAEAANLGVTAVRAQIIFDTTVAYFDLMRARQQEAKLGVSFQRLGGYVAIVETLQHSGRAIPNDVLRIRSARDATQLSLANAHQAAEHASIILASLIGPGDQDDLQVALVSDLPAPPSANLNQSPAYEAAERQVRAAEALVAAAHDERYPTIKIALTAGWLGIDPPKTFGHHLGASYDTAVAVPIFQGGLVRSHIDQALASQHLAEAQRKQTQLALARDLADANNRYVNAVKQLEIVVRSQKTADDSFALDWTRFLGGGNVTILEVIDAYQQAETLQLTRLDQEFVARQASAQAALILGIAR